MEQSILDRSIMLRYLLGLLSDEERMHVEETFFQDDACFEQLTLFEDDLIDDYVRGRLSGETLKAFEEKLRLSDRWKQRVRFAQTLDRRIGLQPPQDHVAASGSTSFLRRLITVFRNQRPVLQVAMATAGLILLGGVALVTLQVFQHRGILQSAQTERQNWQTIVDDLKIQIAGLQKQDKDLRRQLDDERLKREELENQRPGSGALGMVASFVLQAGLVRGNDSAMRITIPPAARTMRLQLELNPAGDYPAYFAELRTATGTSVATRNPLTPVARGAGKVVTLEVPAQSLSAGQYEVALLGRVDPDKFEKIAYYYFDVQR